jgi:iron complex transport system substrate-binding protein
MTQRTEHRIVSLLPSATEIACALGLGEQLVGITHCCDHPRDEIQGKAVVVRSALPVHEMSMSEIDKAVAERLHSGESLYLIQEDLLRDLAPTLLLTQDLCQVCAPAGNEIARALKALKTEPRIVWMSPHSIHDIESDILAVGKAANSLPQAQRLIASMEDRLDYVRRRCWNAERVRVFCAEWLDPLYCSGHWVPEMVEIAGGHDLLGRKWKDSARISWENVRDAAPDVILVMACGMKCADAGEAAGWLRSQSGFEELTAVRNNRVFVLDASYFSKPGPRVVDGTELLAHLLHPEIFSWSGAPDAFALIQYEVV